MSSAELTIALLSLLSAFLSAYCLIDTRHLLARFDLLRDYIDKLIELRNGERDVWDKMIVEIEKAIKEARARDAQQPKSRATLHQLLPRKGEPDGDTDGPQAS